MLCPMDLLPTELVGAIFTQCSELCPDTPLILRSVCKPWGSVVSRNPRMWCRLRAKSNEETKAAQWFEQSGACLIDVCVDIQGFDDDTASTVHIDGTAACARTEGGSELAGTPSLPTLLALHSSRIRLLVLRASSERQHCAFLAEMYKEPTALSLRNIRLHMTTGDAAVGPTVHTGRHPVEVDPHYPTRGIAAVLQNIVLPSPWLHLKGLSSLSVLRPLRAAPLSVTSILDVLELSPDVQTVKITSRIMEQAGEGAVDLLQDPRKVVLQELRHLKITANNIHDILNALVMPRLESLHLVDLDGRAPLTGRALKQLLSTVGEKDAASCITSLRLECVIGVEPGTMDYCLRRLPNLERLVLERCFVVDAVMSSLVSPPPSTLVCPNLGFLAFATCRRQDLPAIACLALARPRVHMCVLDDSDAGLCERGCLPRKETASLRSVNSSKD